MEIKAAATRFFVTDIETCCKFYRDQLKLPVVMEDLDRGYAEFQAASLRLSLFRQQEMAEIIHTTDKPVSADTRDKVALILIVSSVDECYQKLHHEGIHFDEPPTQNSDFNLKVAYCRDPEGNLIGLFEPLM